MCPDKSKGLVDTYGDKFKELYCSYEEQGNYIRQVKAREVWTKILESQIETGVPYIAFKDHVNKKNNQKNVGVIKSSNLCNEINEYSDENETAVCNLASIAINRFVKDGVYDFNALIDTVCVAVSNLNKIIDINYYPTEKCRKSNMRHRPIGLGIQGLADLFFEMRYDFVSDEAKNLQGKVMETIYYAALLESNEIAKNLGPYETFEGSPFSQGILQFDLWGIEPTNYPWSELKESIIQRGTRNSLLTALMPTASTSQILGNIE